MPIRPCVSGAVHVRVRIMYMRLICMLTAYVLVVPLVNTLCNCLRCVFAADIGSPPIRCAVVEIAPDGSSITVDTPQYEELCGNATECPNQPLLIVNPGVGGVAVSCPPFCPGFKTAQAPLPVAVVS